MVEKEHGKTGDEDVLVPKRVHVEIWRCSDSQRDVPGACRCSREGKTSTHKAVKAKASQRRVKEHQDKAAERRPNEQRRTWRREAQRERGETTVQMEDDAPRPSFCLSSRVSPFSSAPIVWKYVFVS